MYYVQAQGGNALTVRHVRINRIVYTPQQNSLHPCRALQTSRKTPRICRNCTLALACSGCMFAL